MGSLIDTRNDDTGNDNIGSRQRFEGRYKKHIDDAYERAIGRSVMGDIGKEDLVYTIPKSDLDEPHIQHGNGGSKDFVLPGNEKFVVGDRFKKPSGGGTEDGKGKDAGKPSDSEAGGEIAFIFSIEDYRNRAFNDLGLPNQTKKIETDSEEIEYKRSGYASQGPMSQLDMRQSMLRRRARIRGAETPIDDQIIELLEEILGILKPSSEAKKAFHSQIIIPRKTKIAALEAAIKAAKTSPLQDLSKEDLFRVSIMEDTVAELRGKKRLIPQWNETTDLRYRHTEAKPVPTSKALIVCQMDVSASVNEEGKKRAKLFFWLLSEMVSRNHKQVDIVFIRHTTVAKEVDEDTFFNKDIENGGTLVSPAHLKMMEIIKTGSKITGRPNYSPAEWNIYGAHVSDGDNMTSDNPETVRLMREMIPNLQGYFYAEARDVNNPMHSYSYSPELWNSYEKIAKENADKFFMGKINQRSDIWPVFRSFFTKDRTPAAALSYTP